MEPSIDILENHEEWVAEFEQNWKAHLLETGQTDFKRYNRVRNKAVPAAAPIQPGQSRILLISSAGGYLRDGQTPFDAADDLGDYSIRTFPATTPLGDIAFAHDHYDHTNANFDPQVVLPLRHLEAMAREGIIGELAGTVVSFMGYQPDAIRTVEATYPAILEVAQREKADGALLIPV